MAPPTVGKRPSREEAIEAAKKRFAESPGVVVPDEPNQQPGVYGWMLPRDVVSYRMADRKTCRAADPMWKLVGADDGVHSHLDPAMFATVEGILGFHRQDSVMMWCRTDDYRMQGHKDREQVDNRLKNMDKAHAVGVPGAEGEGHMKLETVKVMADVVRK